MSRLVHTAEVWILFRLGTRDTASEHIMTNHYHPTGTAQPIDTPAASGGDSAW